jgi:hypothetical protein
VQLVIRSSRNLVLGCLVATLLAAAGPARAATLVVEFDLSASTSAIVLNPGVLTASGQSVGTLTLTFTGVGSDGSLLGPPSDAFLSDLSLMVSSTTTIPMVPDFSATSEDRLTQTGTARGQFDGMRLLFDARQIAGQHDATTLCQNPLCPVLSIIDRPDGPFANLSPFALELTSLDMPGSAMLRGTSTFPFALGAPQLNQTVLRLRGTEVRRSVVPEPAQLGLLALAALGVAALRRSRRAAQPRGDDA